MTGHQRILFRIGNRSVTDALRELGYDYDGIRRVQRLQDGTRKTLNLVDAANL